MTKIALITIHKANNYGAILQSYATKKVLSQFGEVKTIDYNNRYLNRHLDFIRFTPSIHGLKMLVHDLLRITDRIKVISSFRRFIKENMNLTAKLSSEELMQGMAGEFDTYVCGSDQIWNPLIVTPDKKIDPIFFLSFAPRIAKKISYASSIGGHQFTDAEKKQVKGLLEDFSMISTRESDGEKKLSEILPDRVINHVLDPTLLLSKDEWLAALNIVLQKPKEKYILVYSVPRTELIKNAVNYFSKKLNLKIIAIDQMLFPLTKVDEHIRDAGIKTFVELFANAEFIITDSFHGVCFAVNFGKSFVAISAGKKSNRIESLLDLLNINDRLLSEQTEFDNLEIEINTRMVLSKLSNARIASKDILFQIFK